MTTMSLVCPFDENLLSSFSNQTVVIDTVDPGALKKIHDVVRSSENRLETVRLFWEKPLSDFVPKEDWREIPVVLYAPRFGKFRPFIGNKAGFRKLSFRFFLSADDPETPVSLKILASLGFSCGLFFGAKAPDWDLLNDLMHYVYYSRVYHYSPIEPFNHIEKRYDPTRRTTIDEVYFDDPARYLHIDKEGNLALTAKLLKDGVFTGKGVETIPSVIESAEYRRHNTAWQEHMLKRDACSFCPSFRICSGRFAASMTQSPGCREFFQDVLDGVEHVRKTGGRRGVQDPRRYSEPE
jgi:hypothetical protein